VSQLEPTKSNSHFNVAFASSELGQLYEAEAQFRAALKIENNMDRAWYGLGLVLVRQGRTAEALEAFKINTKLQPMSPYGWYQLGRVHKELGDMDAAEKVVHKLNGFEPKVAAQLARDLGV
jgi:tetratricopeptide (TPR) repeat protein